MARKSRRNSGSYQEADARLAREKAAAYIWLSHETEGSRERDSIGNQTALVEGFILNHPELELYGTYVDDSVSGTTFSRPSFNRMLSHMRSGLFQAIVVKDMSRIGRDYIEAGNLVEHVFPLYGIRLISITDGFDTKKDPGGVMMAVANLANAMYAQDISRKINTAKEVMSEKGHPIGKVPFGYAISRDDPRDPRMVIDEETAPIVRRIFSDFLSGKGTTLIARELNAEGILTDREYRFKKNGQLDRMGRYKWSACTVQQVLNNETYTGRYAMNKVRIRISQQKQRIFIPKDKWRYFEDHHPAIISKNDFEKAQSLKRKKSPAEKHAANILRNKVFCGCCGGHMGIPDSGAKTPKYMCRRSVNYEDSCSTGYVKKETVYNAVFKAVKDMARLFLDEDSALSKCRKSLSSSAKGEQYDRQIRMQQEKIHALEARKTGLYEDFRRNSISEDEYLSLNNRYSDEMAAASEVIKGMKEAAANMRRTVDTVNTACQKLKAFKAKRKLSQDMADSLIEKVIVYSEDRVEAVFKFDDEISYLMEVRDGE